VREPAEEHLCRQVAPVLMAERTPGSDGLRRHRLHGRRDILAATLTVNHYAFRAFWSGEHELQYRRRKGENNPQVRKFDSGGPMEHQRAWERCRRHHFSNAPSIARACRFITHNQIHSQSYLNIYLPCRSSDRGCSVWPANPRGRNYLGKTSVRCLLPVYLPCFLIFLRECHGRNG
jgi:hypothetical protein